MTASASLVAEAPETVAHPATSMPRNLAFDAAKGIAIIAVVASHVMRGARGDGLLTATPAYLLIDNVLYLFHVPLFLMISGYLAFPRARDGRAQRNRQLSLGYSYLLWSVLSLLAMIALHQHLPAADVPRAFLAILYAPIQHFYFLPILMIGFAMLYWLRSRRALEIAVIVLLAAPLILGWSYYGLHYSLPFFLAGAWLRVEPVPVGRQGLLTVIAALLFAGAAVAELYYPGAFVRLAAEPAIPFSFAACYAVYRLAGAVASLPFIGSALRTAGEMSMPIYLTHVFFTAGSRRGLLALTGHLPVALILLATLLAGVLGPILLDRLAARFGAQRLLGFVPILK